MLDFLNHFFSAVCGQNPDHTWAPGGILLPCCQRCIGLYVGAAVATLLHWWLKPRLTARFLEAHGAFLLVTAPFGFHWVAQGPVLRTVTGVLFGFAVATFLRAPLGQRTEPRSGAGKVPSDAPGRPAALRAYTAGLAAAVLLLPVIAARGGEFAAAILSGTAFCGALAVGVLALADTGVALAAAIRFVRRMAVAPTRP